MDESRVKAFLNKLINDERRWTSDLETEARVIISDIEHVVAPVLRIGQQTEAGQAGTELPKAA